MSIELINDIYRSKSANKGTRPIRGNTPQRTYIQAITKKCFKVIHIEQDLIRLARKIFRSEESRQNLKVPLVFTEQEKIWEITRDGVSESIECNHEEADSRLVLQACKRDAVVVVVAKNTDVLVIFVRACALVNSSSMKVVYENRSRGIC